jgi:transcriptional regulator with XRE-family HTH domain
MPKETSTSMKIGYILKSLRKNLDLTQIEVANRCDISARNYQEIEYGNSNCQIDTLTKILGLYNINLFTFFSTYFINEFAENGVEPLYEVFGRSAFGYRKFDIEGTVTYQCPFSRIITGMEDNAVIGKMKIWSDLTDSSMVTLLRSGLKLFLRLQPSPPSWKVNIKNHKTNSSNPFMGFMRYSRNEQQELTGIEIVIFPLNKVEYAP